MRAQQGSCKRVRRSISNGRTLASVARIAGSSPAGSLARNELRPLRRASFIFSDSLAENITLVAQ